MTVAIKRFLVLLVLVPLAACSWFGDSEEEELTEEEIQVAALENKVPVQSVGRVEVGRTRDGYLITAFGTAPGLGYALPELRVRRGGQPGADGFLEYDFIALQPDQGRNLPPGTTRTRAIRADRPIKLRQLRGVRGIRVFALSGGVQVAFAGAN